MNEKPIIFSTPMVQSILRGEKTQTRMVIKTQPELEWKGTVWMLGGAAWDANIRTITPVYGHSLYNRIPYKPEDVLWVRETWMRNLITGECLYKADGKIPGTGKWQPSVHMRRDDARIFLRVKSVRAEHVQDITPEDAVCEGIDGPCSVDEFSKLWNELNAKRGYSWDANPWVWVIEFERIKREEAEKN